jgi:hypothetical protein
VTSPSISDIDMPDTFHMSERIALMMVDFSLRCAGANREAVWHASAMLTNLGMRSKNAVRAREYLEIAEVVLRDHTTALEQTLIDSGIGNLSLTDILVKPPTPCHECAMKFLCLASSMTRGDERTACALLACTHSSCKDLRESIMSTLVKGWATEEQIISWLELAEGSPF